MKSILPAESSSCGKEMLHVKVKENGL